jgi:hypothetical protein
MGGAEMDRDSEMMSSNVLVVKGRAQELAGLTRRQWNNRAGVPSVPREWTAWLLMAKAGMPQELIADPARVPPHYLRKRLRAATAMMMFPPYAARIEALMAQMPRFAERQDASREARCAFPAD